MAQPDSATKILDIAERRMRQAGYNGVSYRDIAAEMGIKSASIHYHFPKKVDLGTALVQRYTNNFAARLKETTTDVSDPVKMIAAFVDIYRYALEEQRLVCLCAVLGAEAPGLPSSVVVEVKTFFQTNISWLTRQYKDAGHRKPEERAMIALAQLEGAMIISSVNEDLGVFNAASQAVLLL